VLIIQARGGRSFGPGSKNPFFGRENGGAVIENPWFERPRGRAGSRGCSGGAVFAGTGGERVDWRTSGHNHEPEEGSPSETLQAAG